MAKSPFDMSEMMKAFDPEAMKKMFDPQKMMEMLKMPSAGGADMASLIEANKRHFEAMAEAHKSAAEGYKDMLEKQMALFQDVIAPAQKMIAEASDPETIKARTDAMNKAIADGLEVVRKLAESTKTANEQAFNAFKAQVDDAMKAATKK